MIFLKALFGTKEENPEEKEKAEEAKNFDVLKYDGVRALRANQAAYAVKCFTHALKLHDDLEIHDYLSQAYILTDELPQAYEQLQRLAEAQPDNQHIYIRMANVAYMMEDYVTMVDACEKAQLIDSNTPEVMYLYAKACIGSGDTANAVAMLTKAILLNKDYGDAYLLRGEILLKNGDTADADEDATWLLERVPDNEDVLMLKAEIESVRDNIDAAITYYNKVTDINPFNIKAYQKRGELKLKKGDDSGAKEDFEKAQEYAPKGNESQGEQNIEAKVKEAYDNINPIGL